jgi:transcriptional antiterminator RfaH
MAYWTACRLQPNRTALALHFLSLQGYEVYCPRLREPRVLHDRRVEVLLPLFPGYTFLRVVTGWWQARWAPGTCGLVMDGTTPAKVPDAVIAEIRPREREGAIELPPQGTTRRSGASATRSVPRSPRDPRRHDRG